MICDEKTHVDVTDIAPVDNIALEVVAPLS